VRRYGFHGLSYEFIWRQLQTDDPDAKDARIVIAHLGNGASLCAIHKGRSIASSMGFSPLDGVAMGTRCGQIDPGVLLYLMQYKNLNPQQISDLLYKDSGLKALSGGLSSDMRTLEASDRPEAKEAILYFVQRVQQEIVSLTALMQGLDILVFTGGIGENSRKIRAMVMSGLGWIGVELDAARNDAADLVLSTSGSKVRCLRICTNEEITIAGYTLSLAGNAEFEAERINASA
jgi:acetate kinase